MSGQRVLVVDDNPLARQAVRDLLEGEPGFAVVGEAEDGYQALERARELGLVNEVFDSHEAVVAHALETAREIASKSPLAVTGSKVMINYARDHSIRDGLDYIATWQTGMFSPPHMGEAFTAKAQGREPVYPDLLPLRKRM